MISSNVYTNGSPDSLHEAEEKVSKSLVLQTKKQLASYYDGWAKDFDSHCTALGYLTPEVASKLFFDYVKNDHQTAVLDVGAGTGHFPYHLRNKIDYVGQIDVMDGSMEMLYAMSKKNLSIRTMTCHLVQPDGELPFKKASYDAVTCFGSLLPNHMPVSIFEAMLAVAKPGAFIFFNMRNRSDVTSHNKEIAKAVDQLVQDGKVQHIAQKIFGHMKNMEEYQSTIYVYQKIKNYLSGVRE